MIGATSSSPLAGGARGGDGRAGGPHAQVAARQRVVGATSSSPLAGGLGGVMGEPEARAPR